MRVLNFKNIVKYTAVGGQCLLFQGCSNWFNSGSNSEQPIEQAPQVGQVSESTDNSSQAEMVRALPRRPVQSTTTELAASKENVIEAFTEVEVDDGPAPSFVNFGEENYYTVKNGDSLWKIAKKHSIDFSTLLQANGFSKNTMLRPGTKIIVPGYSASSVNLTNEDASTYVVKNGDSLSVIASRFGTSVNAIKSANNLRSNNIFIGQKLKLNGSGVAIASSSSSSSKKTSSAAKIEGDTYTVKSGDTLEVIAKRCGKKVSDLMAINNISNAKSLRIGKVLNLGKINNVEQEVKAEVKPEVKEESLSVNTTEEPLPSVEPKVEVNEDIKLDNDDDLFTDNNDSLDFEDDLQQDTTIDS